MACKFFTASPGFNLAMSDKHIFTYYFLIKQEFATMVPPLNGNQGLGFGLFCGFLA